MKASELIEKLQKIVAENGDLEILRADAEWGSESIDDVVKMNKTGSKFILRKDSVWPNLKYAEEYYNYDYFKIE